MIDHSYFLETAKWLSANSHCVSLKVGAIAVREGRIVASGINGTLAGEPNCDDRLWMNVRNEAGELELVERVFNPLDYHAHHEWANVHEIHAEQNIISFAAKHGLSLKDCIVYTSHQPCEHCAKLLAASGIAHVYYGEAYVKSKALNQYGEMKIEKLDGGRNCGN